MIKEKYEEIKIYVGIDQLMVNGLEESKFCGQNLFTHWR